MRYRRTLMTGFLLLAVGAAGCEDLPSGPGGVDALSIANGSRMAGLSLEDLFAAAVFRIRRDAGPDSATAVLGRWRAAENGTGRAEARRLEAQTVLDVFGPGLVEQATAVVTGSFVRADSATAISAPDPAEARRSLAASARDLERARELHTAHPVDALLALDDAAGRLVTLRASLAEAERAPTLDDLYSQALARAPDAAGAERVADRAFTAAVTDAHRTGAVVERYAATEALRRARSAFVASVLGPGVAEDLLDGIADRLAAVEPTLDRLDDAGANVGRERRMTETVESLASQARDALAAGDVAHAIDLAAHAAGLAGELQRQLR